MNLVWCCIARCKQQVRLYVQGPCHCAVVSNSAVFCRLEIAMCSSNPPHSSTLRRPKNGFVVGLWSVVAQRIFFIALLPTALTGCQTSVNNATQDWEMSLTYQRWLISTRQRVCEIWAQFQTTTASTTRCHYKIACNHFLVVKFATKSPIFHYRRRKLQISCWNNNDNTSLEHGADWVGAIFVNTAGMPEWWRTQKSNFWKSPSVFCFLGLFLVVWIFCVNWRKAAHRGGLYASSYGQINP